VVRGYRCAQPTAIDRHRVAMRDWLGAVAGTSGVDVVVQVAEMSGDDAVRGVGDSSAPSGQEGEGGVVSTGCASRAFEAALPLVGRAALHRVATGLRPVGAGR
jgi:hypothetical protein